jgi:hypothetical protein
MLQFSSSRQNKTCPIFTIEILIDDFFMVGLWRDSLEILTFLLEEKQSPTQNIFELTLQALAAHNQVGPYVDLGHTEKRFCKILLSCIFTALNRNIIIIRASL